MPRILKRPMFSRGGSTNENNGIMDGLVDRTEKNQGGRIGYAEGKTQAEIYADEYYDQLSKIQPPKPKFNLGEFGMNLASGKYAGDGFVSSLVGSGREPYSKFTAADDKRRNLDYTTRMTAAKMGISKADAEALLRAKAKKAKYIVLSPEQAKAELKEAYNPKVAYQRDLEDDKIYPIGSSPKNVINIGDKVKAQIEATKEEKLNLGYQESDDVLLTKDIQGNIVGSKILSSADKRMQIIGKAVKDSKLQEADDALRELENYIVVLQKEGGENLPGIGTFGGKNPDVFTSKKGLKLRALLAAYENITLKKRSGAAVTPSELLRVQNELAGAANTADESVFLDILRTNRKILEKQKKATFALYREADLLAYTESGGLSLYDTPLVDQSNEDLINQLEE